MPRAIREKSLSLEARAVERKRFPCMSEGLTRKRETTLSISNKGNVTQVIGFTGGGGAEKLKHEMNRKG